MLSNNVGIECHSGSTFGEHLGTHTPGILGKGILYGHMRPGHMGHQKDVP